MRPRTITARVVVAAALAILLAVVVLGVAVELLVGRNLHRSLDETLRQRAVEVAQLSASAPALVTTPGALDSPVGGRQLLVEVLDRQGRIVARSLALGGRLLPGSGLLDAAIGGGRPGYGDVRLGSDDLRVYVAPLADLGGAAGGGAVVVASPTREIEATLHTVRDFLLVSAAAAAFAAALAAAWLMRRALRPLRRLSESAAEIERTGDSSRRLATPGTHDELAQLADTLNGMLVALDDAREAERRFVADASHELRTPLTALRGNVSYIARHGAEPEVVADLEADARRLSQLLDDLLALSREDAAAPPRERVSLDELARAVAPAPGLVIEAPYPVLVRGDRPALERALSNLVENARRYGPEGGRIEVAVGQVNGVARLSVDDEGPGLTGDAAGHAFERFWRGAPGPDGSGLGLAIVRATAERHGGRATVSGSRFTIELPALRDLSETGATTEGVRPEKGSP